MPQTDPFQEHKEGLQAEARKIIFSRENSSGNRPEIESYIVQNKYALRILLNGDPDEQDLQRAEKVLKVLRSKL